MDTTQPLRLDDLAVTEVQASYHNTFEDKQRGEWPKFGATMSAAVQEGQDPDEVLNLLNAACKAHVDKLRVRREFEFEVDTEAVERLAAMSAEEFLALVDQSDGGNEATPPMDDFDLSLGDEVRS